MFNTENLITFYVLLAVHPCIILWIKPTWCTIFLSSIFISFLYMFRATMCPSSGETTVSKRHLVLVILYGWNSTLHTRQSLITRVGTLIVANIYLQVIQNRYMLRSFTVLQCSHQNCVQPVASDVEVVGYL